MVTRFCETQAFIPLGGDPAVNREFVSGQFPQQPRARAAWSCAHWGIGRLPLPNATCGSDYIDHCRFFFCAGGRLRFAELGRWHEANAIRVSGHILDGGREAV